MTAPDGTTGAVVDLYLGNHARLVSPPLRHADGRPIGGGVRVAIHAAARDPEPIAPGLRVAARPVSRDEPTAFEATLRAEALRVLAPGGLRSCVLVWTGPGLRLVQKARVHPVREG